MTLLKNKIPPPVLLLIFGVAMWFLAHSEFAVAVAIPYALVLAIALAAIGIFISGSAIRRFRAADTTVNPLKPETASVLVQGGIFGKSRNPMYVGLLLVLAGWAVWLESLSCLGILLLFVVVITELQIKPEEKALRTL
ncbi:MAG: methyltransferase [Proteobacteria bacterium]|nr:methyltransferase [Pseudomonadota bacterium]MDA1064423.1 methyltransferase [Pseudomonadota bacterium]